MTSNGYFLHHQRLVQAQLDSVDGGGGQAQVAGGVLLAGHKKDLVLMRKLATRPNRVAIYGWHQLSGEPIQPVSTVHVAEYADYSHGVRLIWGHGLVYVTERNRAKAAV
ncbi:MAG TPA: hypothetical protein DIC52_26690 [Candidatus Latescibacteria bacterium]|nr:hypothetical protein [Candidatus Latescibacterota bacterium]